MTKEEVDSYLDKLKFNVVTGKNSDPVKELTVDEINASEVEGERVDPFILGQEVGKTILSDLHAAPVTPEVTPEVTIVTGFATFDPNSRGNNQNGTFIGSEFLKSIGYDEDDIAPGESLTDYAIRIKKKLEAERMRNHMHDNCSFATASTWF